MPAEFRSPGQPYQHRIALIACYFGKLPPYASLVFQSAAYNASIDWLIMNSAREMALPGYLRRMAKKRATEYKQRKLDPLGLGPTLIK